MACYHKTLISEKKIPLMQLNVYIVVAILKMKKTKRLKCVVDMKML